MSAVSSKIPVTQDGLVELVKHGIRNGNHDAVVDVVRQWSSGAATEIDALSAECDRLAEALKWAVGFIQCNMPKTSADYPDMRNCESLIAGTPYSGEFHRQCLLAEQAEYDRDRYRKALEIISAVYQVIVPDRDTTGFHLRLVDAVLAGADVRDLATVEAIEAGTWKLQSQEGR